MLPFNVLFLNEWCEVTASLNVDVLSATMLLCSLTTQFLKVYPEWNPSHAGPQQAHQDQTRTVPEL